MNNLYIKQNIFSIFDTSRVLFNNFYNGHLDNYNDMEIIAITNMLKVIENNINEIKEEIKYSEAMIENKESGEDI